MCGGGRTSRHPPLGIVGGGGEAEPRGGGSALRPGGTGGRTGESQRLSGSDFRFSCQRKLSVIGGPGGKPAFPPATPQAHAHALPSTSGGGHGDGGGQVGPGVSHRPLPPFSPGRRGPFPAGRQPLFWDPAVLPGPAHLRPPPAGLPLWSAGRCGSLAG